jgi:vancomycin resistance protein VanW
MAISRINGTVIQPGQTFSLWKQLGRVTRRKGYVDGMLLSDGKVVRGLGGGLCQLSNLLHWMFLHADTTITERYHHSVDAFPDSGRTIPFGSGATIFDNYIDLQMRNMSPHPLQICLSLTDTQLKGQLRSTHHKKYSYHVREAFHCFVRSHHRWYRYNTLERDVLSHGKIIDTHTVCENLAPVAYAVDTAYLAQYLTLDLEHI